MEESCDAQLQCLFNSITSLHQNFYEGYMPERTVADGIKDVEETTRRPSEVLDSAIATTTM